MARKRTAKNLIVLVVLALATVGGFVVYNHKTTQNGITGTRKAMERIEKAAESARRAW